MSTPSSASCASWFRYSPSLCFAAWMPGVSTNTSCASGCVRMASCRWRVVWGRGETAAIFCPSRALISVDFPTLSLPMTATYPELKSGIWLRGHCIDGFIVPRVIVGDRQAGDDERAAHQHLPAQLLAQEGCSQDHAAHREQIRDHGGPCRTDLVDQIITQNERESRAQYPQP